METLDNQKLIEDVVRQVEGKTSGEVVVVTVNTSSRYKSAHLRSGILFSLLVVFFPMTHHFGHNILFFQAPLFVLGYLLCFIPWVKSFLIFPHEKAEEVSQRSVQAFFEKNLHTTKERTGVLIFVSLLERQVIILADSGINLKVEKGTWQNIMDDLIKNIKKKNLLSGLQNAVLQVGEILAQHFPPNGTNPNELSDRPTFLKK